MRLDKIRSFIMIILGNFLYALTVQLFLTPSGITTGGGTGLAIFANRVTGIPISGFVFVLNSAMLILGWIVLGKSFALSTIISTFAMPISLRICETVLHGVVLTQDPMLCAVFSGLGIGCALGIVIREGASTGGMDIPPLVLHKLFQLPVSSMMMIFDILILCLQAGVSGIEFLLYGVVNVIIYTATLDKILLMGSSRVEVKIISEKSHEIRKAVLSKMDRGVTMLNGTGGFSGAASEVLLTVVGSRELPKLEKIAHEIDPDSFIIVCSVSEVRGRGFTLQKEYKGEGK